MALVMRRLIHNHQQAVPPAETQLLEPLLRAAAIVDTTIRAVVRAVARAEERSLLLGRAASRRSLAASLVLTALPAETDRGVVAEMADHTEWPAALALSAAAVGAVAIKRRMLRLPAQVEEPAAM